MTKFLSGMFLLAAWALVSPAALAQDHENIGTFDINKVTQAVENAGTSGISADSQKSSHTSSPIESKVRENWTLVSLRIGLYLFLTIVAIFGVIWGIKKIGLSGRSRIGGGSMDVLEALPIGQNRSIILVRVVDKVYLIGQTPQEISVLETIEGQKALELISSTKGVVSIAQFKDVFNNFMGKFKK